MKSPEETCNLLIERLTSGASVDWAVERARFPQDIDYIEQLKSIEKIFSVLNTDKATVPEDLKPQNEKHQFTWGHLQVIEPVGSGNFGEVFRAFDPLLNRDVALKLLKTEQMSVTKSRHFMAEARSLAKVRNRHVLAIHGASMHDGRVGFWADLLSGDTLADTTVDYSTESQLLSVCAAVTDALSAVHQAGLIHGDVKLSNVMSGAMTDEGFGKITLMDFGAGGEIDMAASNTGSPILMAPELFNEQPKTAASDIYALGVMLFKLATGQYPIKADNVLEVMQAHKNQKYESLHALRPDLSKSVIQLINQMLSLDPSHRPDTAVIKTTLTEIEVAPKRRVKRMIIAGLFSVLAIATLVSSWGFFQANEAKKIAETEEQKATAVSGFLQEMLESPRQMGEGRDLKVVKLLDYSAETATVKLADQPAALAAIESALGGSYGTLLLHEKAVKHLKKSLALNETLNGHDSQSVLEDLHQLAFAYNGMQNFEQSNAVALRVIDVALNNPNVDKVNVSRAYLQLGINANNQENFAEGLDYLDHELVKIELPNEAATSNIARVLQAKSESYYGLGQYAESEDFARQALDWIQAWNQVEANIHKKSNLVPARNQLAKSLNSQGKTAESEIQLRLAVEQAKLYYGKESNGYLTPLNNLSVSLSAQGKYQEALDIGEQVLELNLKLHGRMHMSSIYSGMGVANSLVGLGRLAEGEEMMRTSLADITSLRGEDSRNALILEYNLAELLIKQSNFVDAEQLSEVNYNRMLKVLGERHPFTHMALSNLAAALTGQRRFDEAKLSHKKALDGVSSLVDEKHPFYFPVVWNQINYFYLNKQKIPGIEKLERLIENQIEELGAAHPDTLRSQKLLDEWQ